MLEALGEADARELAERLGAGAPAERIARRAEGNPLFVEQLVAVDAGQDELPASIHAVLAARIDGLEPGERDVLQRASVEGRTFHAGALELGASLVGLVRKDLIAPDRPVFAGEDAFRFTHALIREAAYAGVPKRVRADRHASVAEWLARRDAADAVVGHHLERACRLGAELGQRDAVLAARAVERLERRVALRAEPRGRGRGRRGAGARGRARRGRGARRAPARIRRGAARSRPDDRGGGRAGRGDRTGRRAASAGGARVRAAGERDERRHRAGGAGGRGGAAGARGRRARAMPRVVAAGAGGLDRRAGRPRRRGLGRGRPLRPQRARRPPALRDRRLARDRRRARPHARRRTRSSAARASGRSSAPARSPSRGRSTRWRRCTRCGATSNSPSGCCDRPRRRSTNSGA